MNALPNHPFPAADVAALILESAKDYAIFTTDPQRRITTWNAGAATMFGYAEPDILGQLSDILFTPEDRERGAPESEAEKAQTEGRAENERWHVRQDGSRLYGSGMVTPLRDEAGNVVGLVKVMRDLTQQKLAEEARRLSEEKYRSLFSSIDEGFCIIERVAGEQLDFRYLEANWAFTTQSGVSDVIGKTIRQVVPGEPQEWFDIYDRVLNTQEPIQFERDLVTVGRVLELYAFPVTSPANNQLAVIFKDITERKRQEQRQEFLLNLSDTLRAEPNADAVANRALQMLSGQLRLDRCYIAVYQVEADRAYFTHQTGNERVPPLPEGGIRLSDFPEAFRIAFDRTLVIDDFAQTEGLSDTDRQNISALGLRALVAATLRKGQSHPHWVMVAVSALPRHWTEDEVALIEEVAERTWTAVERARAEAALHESEERLRLATEAADMYAWEIDLRTGVPAFSANVAAVTGQQPTANFEENLRGVHPDDRAVVRNAFEKATQNGTDRFDYEMRSVGTPETLRWYRVSGVLIRDGQGTPVRSVGITQNITTRKQNEEALRAANERFRIAEEATNGFIYDWDKRTDAVTRSEGFTRVLGYAPGDVADTADAWLTLMHPDDRALANSIADAGTQKNPDTLVWEYRVQDKAGNYRYVQDRGRVVQNEAGVVTRVVGSTVDITERKRREEHQKLLIDISGDFSRLSNEEEIVRHVGAKLAAHLGLDCYHYVDVSEERAEVTIRYFWHAQDVAPVLGTYPIDGFIPPSGLESRRAGETDVVNDVQNELTDDTAAIIALKAGAAAQQIGAYVVVPYSRGGAWTAYFAVATRQPRRWTPPDVELVERVASRLFPRIERARAEAALRQSEEKYRTLFNSMDEGVGTIDLVFDEHGRAVDYQILEQNPAWERLTGMTSTALGKRISEVLPTLEPFWFDVFGRVAKTGESARVEHQVAGLNANWYDVYVSRVGGEGSHTLVFVYSNITERKRNEANLAFLADVSQDLVGLTDIGETINTLGAKIGEYFTLSRCLFMEIDNAQEMCRVIHDWGRDDAVTISGEYRIADFISPDFQRTSRAGETVVINDVFADPRTNGARYAALGIGAMVTVPLLRGGEWHFLLGFYDTKPRHWQDAELELMRELSHRIWTRLERARAEGALRDSEKRLRLAIEATELGTWEWNLLTNEVYWNERHFRLFGMEPQPNPIGPGAFFDHIHPHERERVSALLKKAIAERSVYDAEFCALLDDGTERWMSGYGRVVEEVNGQPSRMSGVMFDIDERRRAEEALRDASRRKDEFLALLAHELRNPLATLQNTLHVLTLTGGYNPDLPLPTATSLMSREVGHLTRLVDELLDVSRISRGKITLLMERVDLLALMREVLNTDCPEMRTTGPRHVHITLPDAPLWINGDLTRLKQVVSNLLHNAVKFTPTQGNIWVHLLAEDGRATLRIRDDGIGIPAGELERIFETFAQVDTGLRRGQSGLGLGLTLVRELVQLHGGHVAAHSAGEGQGSTFVVVLPLIQQEENVVKPEAPAPPATPAKRRVMVVDDNRDAATTLSLLLKYSGNDVHTFYDGPSALAAAETLRPAVVLLDISMPGMDGYEVCRQLRAQPWSQMKLIALSGYGQEEDKQRSRQAGFDAHLVKPVDMAVLNELLRSV